MLLNMEITKKEIKEELLDDLLKFESDLTRITIKRYNKIMRLINKVTRKVEKYYE